MINVFLNQIDERFKNLEKNELLCQATLLDPRFKKFGFSDVTKANFAFESLKKKLLLLHVPLQLNNHKMNTNWRKIAIPNHFCGKTSMIK